MDLPNYFANMINYWNKEERKVFSESLARHFPLNSLTVIRQNAITQNRVDSLLVPAEKYFDTLNYDSGGIILFLQGNNGLKLCVDIDLSCKEVTFVYISKNANHCVKNIEFCHFSFDSWDLIDILTGVFMMRRHEYRLAKYLFKLAKDAYIRNKKKDSDEKIKALKEELL